MPITTMEELERKLFQHCSGNFLTENVPDGWDEMEEEEQLAFLSEHGWEPLVDHPALREVIGTAADSLKRFLMREGILDDCDHTWVNVEVATVRNRDFCSKCKKIRGNG